MADISIQGYDSKNRVGYRKRMVDVGGFYAEAVFQVQYRSLTFPPVPAINAAAVAIPTAAAYSLVTGTLQAAGAVTAAKGDVFANSSVTLAVGASATDKAYTGLAIRITSGTGTGARGTITGYTGASKVATVNWGTGARGTAGVPTALDNTSVYELSIDCYNRGKVICKTEYGNSTCTAKLSIALRDQNGVITDTAAVTPANLGTNDKGVLGYRGRGLEVPCDGFDTAILQVETAASGGATPTVSCWGAAV